MSIAGLKRGVGVFSRRETKLYETQIKRLSDGEAGKWDGRLKRTVRNTRGEEKG